MSAKKDVVFSGMRPTGRLHLGNHWGALKNWVALQDRYECRFMVADLHTFTTSYGDTASLQENIREMVLDWLAAGLDPERCVIFKQSDVPEHAELALLLGMVTPLAWLENNPTWKEQLQELAKTKHSQLQGHGTAATLEKTENMEGSSELRTFGFLGYPVLQAADILLYHGTKVPVGQDQLPHLELSREIARKFNHHFGPVFVEPQPILTPAPRVPGLDGRKMSKSYGNALDLYETKESLSKKTMSMYTDPGKIKKDSPGNPEPCAENPPGCVVYALEKLYLDPARVARIGADCRSGKLGCVADKRENLLPALEAEYAKFRAARERLAGAPGRVDQLLRQGAQKARAVAQKTMDEVRRAMRLAS